MSKVIVAKQSNFIWMTKRASKLLQEHYFFRRSEDFLVANTNCLKKQNETKPTEHKTKNKGTFGVFSDLSRIFFHQKHGYKYIKVSKIFRTLVCWMCSDFNSHLVVTSFSFITQNWNNCCYSGKSNFFEWVADNMCRMKRVLSIYSSWPSIILITLMAWIKWI